MRDLQLTTTVPSVCHSSLEDFVHVGLCLK